MYASQASLKFFCLPLVYLGLSIMNVGMLSFVFILLGFTKFMNLYIYVFHQIWENSGPCFLKYVWFSSVSSFSFGMPVTWMLSLFILRILTFFYLCSYLFFRLNNFHWFCVKQIPCFFVISFLQLIPLSDFYFLI